MKKVIFLKISHISLANIGFYQSADTLHFTIREAISYAIANNPQLKVSRLDEVNNEYKIKEIKSSALPQVNGSGTGTDNFQLSSTLLPGEIIGQPGVKVPVKMGTRFVYGANLQLQQTIYNPSLNAGLSAAKASQGLYALQTFKTKEDLIYNLAQVYIQLQIADKQQSLIEGNIERTEKLLDMTQLQYKEGIAKKVDVDQLNVNLTNLKTQYSSTKNDYNQLLNSIKLLMNIDVAQPIALAAPGERELPVSNKLILDANTDLNILDKQIALQELNTKSIKAGFLPTVSLSANYGKQFQTSKLFNSAATSGFASGYYSLNVSIPIFDGFSKRNKIAQSNTALKQLQFNKEYLVKNVQNEFQTATENLNQNRKVANAQEQNMKVAEELYNVAKLSFTEGISPLSELINAENSLREAQTQYLTATLQMNLAELETMKTSGQLSQIINNNSFK